MFCPNCGKNCGDFKFCPECGQKLKSEVEPQSCEERKKALQDSGQVYCPQCLSTGVRILERKNPYIHSPFGGLFWLIREQMNTRSEKNNGMECVCMKCNYKWYTKRQAMRERHAKYISQIWPGYLRYPVSTESYVVLDEIGITIGHYDKMEYLVPYEEVVAVEYRKGLGPLNGRLSIRDRENRKKRFPRTLEEAKQDVLTAFYTDIWTDELGRICSAMKKIIMENKKAGMF